MGTNYGSATEALQVVLAEIEIEHSSVIAVSLGTNEVAG